jgi:hypothetical protein
MTYVQLEPQPGLLSHCSPYDDSTMPSPQYGAV